MEKKIEYNFQVFTFHLKQFEKMNGTEEFPVFAQEVSQDAQKFTSLKQIFRGEKEVCIFVK